MSTTLSSVAQRARLIDGFRRELRLRVMINRLKEDWLDEVHEEREEKQEDLRPKVKPPQKLRILSPLSPLSDISDSDYGVMSPDVKASGQGCWPIDVPNLSSPHSQLFFHKSDKVSINLPICDCAEFMTCTLCR